MESTNNTEKHVQVKKVSVAVIVLIILIIGATVTGTLYFFQKSRVQAEIAGLDKAMAVTNQQIADFNGSNVQGSTNAAQALKQINSEAIVWSNVITEVNRLLPVDSAGKKRIEVLSYSGSGAGRVILNTVTAASALPPFDDVAQLISIFNNSVYFRNVYVPSISRGQTADGGTTLSFVLNMDYLTPDTGAGDVTPVAGSADVPAVKVPRNNQ